MDVAGAKSFQGMLHHRRANTDPAVKEQCTATCEKRRGSFRALKMCVLCSLLTAAGVGVSLSSSSLWIGTLRHQSHLRGQQLGIASFSSLAVSSRRELLDLQQAHRQLLPCHCLTPCCRRAGHPRATPS